jgi:acetyl-CoA carboxylase biotin carboxylase subunit
MMISSSLRKDKGKVMFKKILIANRDEIALRVIRACRELGIMTVAIYSEADKDSLHVRFADESVCVGPPPARESYLNIPQIISAAEITGADAIHPGYGFLSENARFAEICEEHKITFIGPSADTILKMGDKLNARRLIRQAGVPVIPGSEEPMTTSEEIRKFIKKHRISYPIILKAAAGGGGKGMRIITSSDELDDGLKIAQVEAEKAFGDPSLYVEKYITESRHVEFQILGDKYGRYVHLGERECSIQFRHQKLIEEAPSPALDPRLRTEMGKAAIRAARKVKYLGAGTVEFLVDKKKRFYFIEMNTRVQVEHPVTEWVYGRDIVKEQIRLAAGEALGYTQNQIRPRGHAVECRINACDLDNNLAPSPGKVERLNIPGGPGVRVDSALYTGYEVTPYYDSLIAKLITYGQTRDEALSRMAGALEEFIIEGIKTTIPLYTKIVEEASFRNGDLHTHYLIDQNFISKG